MRKVIKFIVWCSKIYAKIEWKIKLSQPKIVCKRHQKAGLHTLARPMCIDRHWVIGQFPIYCHPLAMSTEAAEHSHSQYFDSLLEYFAFISYIKWSKGSCLFLYTIMAMKLNDSTKRNQIDFNLSRWQLIEIFSFGAGRKKKRKLIFDSINCLIEQ